MSALVAVVVTFDGESSWFEGAALIAHYVAIGAVMMVEMGVWGGEWWWW